MRGLQDILIAVVAVSAATAVFALFWAPREDVVPFLGLFFFSGILLGRGAWKSRKALLALRGPEAMAVLLGGALLLRLAALGAPVSLSDDVWRYLWDGQLLLAGDNPYAHRPLEWHQAHGGDADLLAEMNSPERYTVYPPLAQLSFGAALLLEAHFGGAAERWLRGIFVFFDLLGIGMLAMVLRRLGRPMLWAALYGWHPLVYWETAAGGHTEALGIVFLGALIFFALQGKAFLCGAAIGLAGLAKWTFLAISPVVGIYLLRKKGFSAALIATVSAFAVVLLAYWPLYYEEIWEHHGESVRLYSEYFSFNAPLFYSLQQLLGYQEGVTEPVTHITGPLLNGLTILAIGAAALLQDGRARVLIGGATAAAGAYLLFSPVFHPWYGMPFLALAALGGWKTPSVLAMAVSVSYLYYAPWSTPEMEAALMGIQTFAVAGAAMIEFGPSLVEKLLRDRGKKKAEILLGEIKAGEVNLKILDLGGAEGFVGEVLASRGHQVELVDVEDRNRSKLPARVYDGINLPYEDRRFDLVVISYVLHHSRDPDQLLREALRVGRQVLVLETVYEKPWDRRLVTFLDHSANRLRGMAPEPLNFDRVEGWLERIEAAGGEVKSWRWLGRGIHRHVILNFFSKTD